MAIPGWYGKLPSLGDFASRRLPSEFIQPWDAWLQEVIQGSRATMGESWRDGYLTMPIWRFVLLPEVIDPSAWAGVLMPSVDRVGRQFPLTVAVALPSHAAAAHAVFRGGDWFADLEDAALRVLDPTQGPDDLDRVLGECSLTLAEEVDVSSPDRGLRRLPSIEAFNQLAESEALRAWSAQSSWKGLWWTRGHVDGDPLMLTCPGLPTTEEFGWLLKSRVSPTSDVPAEPAMPPSSDSS